MSDHDITTRLLAKELVSLRVQQSLLKEREERVRSALLDAVSQGVGRCLIPAGDAYVRIETGDDTIGATTLARAEIRSDEQYRRQHSVYYARSKIERPRQDATFEVVGYTDA